MEQISGISHFGSTRRWPRHQVDLPVRIIALNGILTTPVAGRGSEISRAGMALTAPVKVRPGDLMGLLFPTSSPARVNAVVRNRTGECLGLEFLSQLPPDNEAGDQTTRVAGSLPEGSIESPRAERDSCSPQALFAGLRRKREELRQVQMEIEALRLAIVLLLAD